MSITSGLTWCGHPCGEWSKMWSWFTIGGILHSGLCLIVDFVGILWVSDGFGDDRWWV